MVQMVKWGLRKYGLHKGHTWDWDLQLPWLAMGYRFSWQASLSYFSPYFLLFGYEFELLALIQWDAMVVINMDDPNVWIQACEQRTTLFWHVMFIAMENLAIAQHQGTLHYAIIHGGGYQL
jgi:hypothetical protein